MSGNTATEELSAQSQALMTVMDELQALVGTDSEDSRVAQGHLIVRRPRDAHLVWSVHRSDARPAAQCNLVLTGPPARKRVEFPLDGQEFKEF